MFAIFHLMTGVRECGVHAMYGKGSGPSSNQGHNDTCHSCLHKQMIHKWTLKGAYDSSMFGQEGGIRGSGKIVKHIKGIIIILCSFLELLGLYKSFYGDAMFTN